MSLEAKRYWVKKWLLIIITKGEKEKGITQKKEKCIVKQIEK